MISDAKDMIIGRVASVAAKSALLGESVDIVNCSDACITGRKRYLIDEFTRRKKQGTFNGPYFPRQSDRIVRRIVRGMIPYRQEKGKTAFKRVRCHNGVPAELSGKEMLRVPKAHISKLPTLHYI